MSTPRKILTQETAEVTRLVPTDVADTIDDARQRERHGRQLVQQGADMTRAAALELKQQGWAQTEIAVVLGVTKQRVTQLLKPHS
jgi:predicted XRE-type DNA-binding protein